jgi:hypothetical protein
MLFNVSFVEYFLNWLIALLVQHIQVQSIKGKVGKYTIGVLGY